MNAITLAQITPEHANRLIELVALLLGLAAALKVFGPLVKALARRIEGGATASAVDTDVADLRARVSELEARDVRLMELEERLDFAERMLQRGVLPRPRADTPPEPSPSLR